MTDRRHLGTGLGKRFPTEEHIVARKRDGLVIRSRAVKLMPDVSTSGDLDAIKGFSVGPPLEFRKTSCPMFHDQF